MSEVNAPARRYHSPRRKEQAAATREAVLVAARELFVGEGYRSTTVAGIARRAGVAVDTISATGQAVPAEQRDYVIRLREASGAARKISIYAHALAGIQPRLAPVYLALRDAAGSDPDCAALWTEISERRAANMLKFVEDLAATGELRTDRTAAELADAVWSMNGPEYWVLLVGQRGWAPGQFAEWLADAWCRLLLAGDRS